MDEENKKKGSSIFGLWLIFFQQSRKLRWYHKIFCRGSPYTHVTAARWHEHLNIWTILDWREQALEIESATSMEMDHIVKAAHAGGARVVSYIVHDIPKTIVFRPPFFYCTTVLQHFLGLPYMIIATPEKLYRQLVKFGAKEV